MRREKMWLQVRMVGLIKGVAQDDRKDIATMHASGHSRQ